MLRFLARAPGRIDLAGGGTDPLPYAEDYGGAVLNLAITFHSHVILEERPQREVEVRLLDAGVDCGFPLDAPPPPEGPAALVLGVLRRLMPSCGLSVRTWSELPRASGLSSSASLGVALIRALSAFRGEDLDRAQVADLHSSIERFDLGIWGGKQDPYACAFGGVRFWLFEGEAVREEPLELPSWVEAVLERDLKLVYSGEARLSGTIHRDILADYRKGKSRVREAQHRLKETAFSLRDALRSGELERAARLLDRNWEAHKQLHPSCSTARLERLIERGKAAGALGAKVCGAGGGGAIVYYVPPEAQRAFGEVMAEEGAPILPFKIDREGLRLDRAGSAS